MMPQNIKRFDYMTDFEKRLLLRSLVCRLKHILCVIEDKYTYYDRDDELRTMLHEMHKNSSKSKLEDLIYSVEKALGEVLDTYVEIEEQKKVAAEVEEEGDED